MAHACSREPTNESAHTSVQPHTQITQDERGRACPPNFYTLSPTSYFKTVAGTWGLCPRP
eukprot:4704789-Alexandrium_andersonii.AAC.1